MCVLALVVETGNLWLARVELTNALEAAALAGVDQWGDVGGNTEADRELARAVAVSFAAANEVNGQPLLLLENADGAPPNNNQTTTGNVIILAAYNPLTHELAAQMDPTASGQDLAVRAQATVTVYSLVGSYCGFSIAPFEVSTQVTASYSLNHPQSVNVLSFTP